MQISEILSPKRILCDVSTGSKKVALEILAKLISNSDNNLTQSEVFDSLLTRERLGSTGLGYGIALPHGRLKHGNTTVGAFIRLKNGIDYDAIDAKPVDLLFALLVPIDSTQEHLEILSQLAERFSNEDFLGRLRAESSEQNIFELLTM